MIKNDEFNAVLIDDNFKGLANKAVMMWEKVSIVRNEQNLKSALERLLEMKEELKDLDVDDRTQFNESLLTRQLTI